MSVPDRQEFRAALSAAGASGLIRDQILGWYDAATPEQQREAAALLGEVRAATKAMQGTAIWLLATHLVEPGLDGAARALLVRRVLDRHLTVDQAGDHADTLRAARGSDRYAGLVGELAPERFGVSLGNAHTVFVHAFRAAPLDARAGVAVVHRGEPVPVFGVRGNVLAGIFTARAVAHLAKGAQRAELDALVALAERALAADDIRALQDELTTVAARKAKPGIASIARAPVAEAHAWVDRSNAIGAALRPSVAKAVKLLADADGAAAGRDFLRGLDDELRRLDVLYALERRDRRPSAEVARAIWRGDPNDEGHATIWCAALTDGRYGLLRKEATRWQWTEGAPADVLALVPDAHFDAVARAARA